MMQKIKKNKDLILSTVIVLIVAVAMLGVAFVIVAKFATQMDQIPSKGFVILGKEQNSGSFWIWHWTDYSFQYGNKTADWIDVSYTTYQKYQVGDFDNETIIIFN